MAQGPWAPTWLSVPNLSVMGTDRDQGWGMIGSDRDSVCSDCKQVRP